MTFLDNDDKARSELDPWPVIVGCLFELDSYGIPCIIDKCGMRVDWRLAQREDYSHKYRKAAYRPRINQAYEALDRVDRLRVAFIVCGELARQGLAEQLIADLYRIGWRIDGGTLAPANDSVHELFFPQGTQHDAYVRIRKIIRRATHSIRIIDPYLDETIFTLLGDTEAPMKIELLTGKPPADFEHETTKFQQQYPQVRIETRRSRDIHDRFIVVDDTECWHIGCSIKDAGSKAFMLSLIEDSRNAEALMASLNTTWVGAAKLT